MLYFNVTRRPQAFLQLGQKLGSELYEHRCQAHRLTI